jgi:hypothetical protein
MIRGLHGLFYSSDADATRAFMRDALRLPFNDVGGGWLIFDLPEGDVGVHPVDEDRGAPANTHDVSFYCDDIHGTVAELRARGVEFKSEPQDHGYGWVTYFTMPGDVEVQLYEPKYEKGAGSGPAAKEGAAKQPGAKQATQKQPAQKQAAQKQPAQKQAAQKQPAAKQATQKQPAAKQAAQKQATQKQPAAKQATQKPAAKQAAQKPRAKQTAQKPAARKATARKPSKR